jgi:hypothetical protein
MMAQQSRYISLLVKQTGLSLYCFVFSIFALPVPAGETGVIQTAMVQIRNTGITFPVLTGYPDPAIMERVNGQIEALTSTFGCEEEPVAGTDTYFKVQSSVEYNRNKILSIYASAAYYCDGPYPTNDSNISLTFDLTKGEKITFEELFKDYETDKEPILETVFAEQIEKSEELMEAGMEADGSCENDPDLFSLEHLDESAFNYYFSDQGLVVQPEWPHAIEACAERVTVPYKALEQFAEPDGILARAIQP